jgi:hypothetical protein
MIISGVAITIILPCIMPLTVFGWNGIIMAIGMLLYYIAPLFGGILLLTLVTCLTAHTPHVAATIGLVGWCTLNLIIYGFAHSRETCDEMTVMRTSYQSDLPLFLMDMKNADVELMLHLRGYGEWTLFMFSLYSFLSIFRILFFL